MKHTSVVIRVILELSSVLNDFIFAFILKISASPSQTHGTKKILCSEEYIKMMPLFTIFLREVGSYAEIVV